MSHEYSLRPTRAVIFGGCVSRDTLFFAGDTNYDLHRYFARHSLLSTGSDASSALPKLHLQSRFQERMLNFDIEGRLLRELFLFANIDVLIWDLNTERGGCYEFSNGSIVTNSPELRRVPGLQTHLSEARKIDFATEEHLYRWQSAATVFVDALDALGIKHKTLVLAPDWALTDADGSPTRKVGSITPEHAPQIFSPYHNHLEKLGVRVSRFKGLTADPKHKWGSAPFHYTSDAYDLFHNEIQKTAKGLA